MSKSKILAEVDAMVSARLFGSGPWLSDPESCVALQRRLEQMGLEERVPSASDTWRNTPLGRELHLDLLMVFMGLWDQWEIPMILEDDGLIDDLEAEHMQDLLQAGRDPELALKEYVREAYFVAFRARPDFRMRKRLTGRLRRQDSNLCISESEFAQTLSSGRGEVEHAHLD